MSATSTVLRGRAAAERLMVDSCVISGADTAERVLDPDTNRYSDGAPEVLYRGKCRVKDNGGLADEVVTAGEEPVTLVRFTVSIPISALEVPVDALVTITASELDPALVGTDLRVRRTAVGTHITARRLLCELDAG